MIKVTCQKKRRKSQRKEKNLLSQDINSKSGPVKSKIKKKKSGNYEIIFERKLPNINGLEVCLSNKAPFKGNATKNIVLLKKFF